MLTAVLESVFECVPEFLAGLFWWIVLFPVVWLVSLPFILVIALFRREPYGLAVVDLIGSVHCFWKDWGSMMIW